MKTVLILLTLVGCAGATKNYDRQIYASYRLSHHRSPTTDELESANEFMNDCSERCGFKLDRMLRAK